jgi:hypothetical protein
VVEEFWGKKYIRILRVPVFQCIIPQEEVRDHKNFCKIEVRCPPQTPSTNSDSKTHSFKFEITFFAIFHSEYFWNLFTWHRKMVYWQGLFWKNHGVLKNINNSILSSRFPTHKYHYKDFISVLGNFHDHILCIRTKKIVDDTTNLVLCPEDPTHRFPSRFFGLPPTELNRGILPRESPTMSSSPISSPPNSFSIDGAPTAFRSHTHPSRSCCSLLIDKARAKDKTSKWVSVRWKAKN